MLEKALAPHKGKDASDIVSALEGFVIVLDPIQDAAVFVDYLESEQPAGGLLGPAHPIPDNPTGAVKHRTFGFTCTLGLADSDGAVCVDELVFDLVPHAGYNAYSIEPRSYDDADAPEMNAIAARSWDYSPD